MGDWCRNAAFSQHSHPRRSSLRAFFCAWGSTMKDDPFGDAVYEAWRRGLNPDEVSRDNIAYNEARGAYPDETAVMEVGRLARERDERLRRREQEEYEEYLREQERQYYEEQDED